MPLFFVSADSMLEVERELTVSRSCARCGTHLRASVQSFGEARRVSPHWERRGDDFVQIDERAAAEETVRLADSDATRNASRLLDLLRCPRCGLRPGLRMLRLRLVLAVAPPLLAALVFGSMIWWASSLSPQGSSVGAAAFGVSLLGGIVAAESSGRRAWRRWANAERRIRLLSDPYR